MAIIELLQGRDFLLKNRFLLASIGVILVFIIIFFSFLKKPIKKEDTKLLQSAMQASFARLDKSLLSLSVNIFDEYFDEKKAHDFIYSIVKDLGYDRESLQKTVKAYRDNFYYEAIYTGKDKNCKIVLYSIRKENKYSSKIIIDEEFSGSESDVELEKQKLMNLFKNYRDIGFSLCLSGSFEQKMSVYDMEEKLSSILESVGAKEVEGIYSESVFSVSAFCESLGRGIRSGGDSINMQIAMRYSPYYDKTFIWIGTPLINIEY